MWFFWREARWSSIQSKANCLLIRSTEKNSNLQVSHFFVRINQAVAHSNHGLERQVGFLQVDHHFFQGHVALTGGETLHFGLRHVLSFVDCQHSFFQSRFKIWLTCLRQCGCCLGWPWFCACATLRPPSKEILKQKTRSAENECVLENFVKVISCFQDEVGWTICRQTNSLVSPTRFKHKSYLKRWDFFDAESVHWALKARLSAC